MEKPFILGFSGLKGSGKSSVARQLSLRLASREYICSVMSFADPMRSMMQNLLFDAGILNSHEYLRDTRLKEEPLDCLQGKSIRFAMQTLGTEWGRQMIGQNFWTDIGIKRAYKSRSNVVIFDDARFPNEAEAIQKSGGRMFHIERPEVTKSATDTHESERYKLGQWVFNGTDNPGDAAAIIDELLRGVLK